MSSRLIVNSIRHTGASGDAVTLANDGTCTANITNRSNRNIIINGAMQVAQRGTSSTLANTFAVDRFKVASGGVDEVATASQISLSTSTSPAGDLFRNAARITNGNQTSGAQAGSYVQMNYEVEAQDMANSGWQYASSSSSITFSFYVRSSVAQTYYGWVTTLNGTSQRYTFTIPVTQADTWTRITKTISGDSNITINNDNGGGLRLLFCPFYGTNYTNNKTLDSWAAADGSNYCPDMTTTWITTNDATFDVTGVQLEVGDHATDFEHRSYAQELALCQRYCEVILEGEGDGAYMVNSVGYATDQLYAIFRFAVEKRVSPTLVHTTGTNYYINYRNNSGINFNGFSGLSWPNKRATGVYNSSSVTAGHAGLIGSNNSSAKLYVTAEL